MKKYIHAGLVCTLTLILLTVGQVSIAQESFRQIFDTDTIGYVRVDLERFDASAAAGMLNDLLGVTSPLGSSGPEAVAPFKKTVDDLKKAGVADVFLVLAAGDIPRGFPSVFLRGGNSAEVVKIAGPLFETLQLQHRKLADGTLFAKPQVHSRLADNRLPNRTDLDEVFALHSMAAVTIVYAPSTDQRRALRETFPDLPGPWSAFTREILADGAFRIAIRLNPAEDELMKVEVLSSDAILSEQLASAVKGLLQKIGSGELQVADLDMRRPKRTPLRPGQVDELNIPEFAAGVQLEQDKNRFSISFKRSDDSYQRLCTTSQKISTLVFGSAASADRSNRLRSLVVACHNFHDAYKSLPPTAITDDSGKPLLSWRVALLPFLGENDLYERFKLDESWDSPHNKQLIEKMPRFMVSDDALAAEFKSSFVMPAGDAVIGRIKPLRLQDIKDGTSRTILIMDVAPDSGVVWTKPDDWQYDANSPMRGLFRDDQLELRAGFADGSVQWLPRDVDVIKAKLTVEGGEIVD